MNKTIICVASGPSLTTEDCLLVRDSGYPVIAVNSTWKKIPWCDHLYAGDHQWWQVNHGKLITDAKLWCGQLTTAHFFGLTHFESPIRGAFNSGQRAILLAFFLGAERIILLGYDCSLQYGTHWHEDHDMGLKNPDETSIRHWQDEFAKITQLYNADKVINCSRNSQLRVFPKGKLEDYLRPRMLGEF